MLVTHRARGTGTGWNREQRVRHGAPGTHIWLAGSAASSKPHSASQLRTTVKKPQGPTATAPDKFHYPQLEGKTERRLNQVSSVWSENKYLLDTQQIIGIRPGKATYTTIMLKDIPGYSAERNDYTVKYYQTYKIKASLSIIPETRMLRLIQ